MQCGGVEEDEGKETRSAQIEGSFKRDGVWLMLCDHAVMRPGEWWTMRGGERRVQMAVRDANT